LLILATSFNFAQYPLVKKIGSDSVVIMTLKQGNQINESFDNNEKTITILRDSLKLLRFNALQTRLQVDTTNLMYEDMKLKHDVNIQIYKASQKEWKKIFYYQQIGTLVAISFITLFIALK
jgi:hypothetical protein